MLSLKRYLVHEVGSQWQNPHWEMSCWMLIHAHQLFRMWMCPAQSLQRDNTTHLLYDFICTATGILVFTEQCSICRLGNRRLYTGIWLFPTSQTFESIGKSVSESGGQKIGVSIGQAAKTWKISKLSTAYQRFELCFRFLSLHLVCRNRKTKETTLNNFSWA